MKGKKAKSCVFWMGKVSLEDQDPQGREEWVRLSG